MGRGGFMADTKRVLVVDDDKLVQRVLTKVLERVGVEAVAVSSSDEAVAKLEEGIHFDMAIVDLIMPLESGWDLIDKIERNTVIPNIPIVAITGVALSAHEMDKLRKRTLAVVCKGDFSIDKMKNLMDDLLKDR
jgi:CheY-like chemotaxis protein